MRAIVIAALFLAACSSGNDGFDRVGYFRDEAKNRVMTFVYEPKLSAPTVRNYAENIQYTTGQITAAYFYGSRDGAPTDDVTLAPTLTEANAIIYQRPNTSWRFAYVRGFSGDSVFVDCRVNPGNDLCRR